MRVTRIDAPTRTARRRTPRLHAHGVTRCCVTAIAWLPIAFSAVAVGQDDVSIAELQAKIDALTVNVDIDRGRHVYFRACAPCHGVQGDGKGPAAIGFDPAPRNFRRGVYKFRTTITGLLPTDSDIERTIREGVPGTEMPRWAGVLSESDIRAVARYVKTFSDLFSDPYSQLLPEDVLDIPEQRPFEPTLASVAAGRQIYIEQDCGACHGDAGRGDGPQADELADDWGVPIRPADLTRPYFKNGKRDRDIYRVFTSALNGTPMPAFDDLSEEQRWQLVDYVQSLERERGFIYWLFVDNPNQVRHPEASDAD